MQAKGKSNSIQTYIILALALGAMTFFGLCTPSRSRIDLDGVAAKVDGNKIKKESFLRNYELQAAQLKRRYGTGYDPGLLRVADGVLDHLVQNLVYYLEGVKLFDLKVSESAVLAYLQNNKAFLDEEGNFSEKNFYDRLLQEGYSEASFIDDLGQQLAVEELKQIVQSSVHFSGLGAAINNAVLKSKVSIKYLKVDVDGIDLEFSTDQLNKFLEDEANLAQVKAWYEANQEDYQLEAKIHARHILLAYKGARNAPDEVTRNREAAKKEAEAIYSQLQDGGDFAKLAAKSDEYSGRDNAGDLGFFTRGTMVKEFSDVAFTLKPGEVSEPVLTPFGYHIIKLEEKQEAGMTEFAEVKLDIAEKLLYQKEAPEMAAKRAQEVLQAVAEDKKVSDLLLKYGLVWEEAEDLSPLTPYIPGIGDHPELQAALGDLSEEQPLLPRVLKVKNKQFLIIKLEDQHLAKISDLKVDEREQVASALAYEEGAGAFEGLFSVDDYKVEKNEGYLALDQMKNL